MDVDMLIFLFYSSIVCACLPIFRPIINILLGRAPNWTALRPGDSGDARARGASRSAFNKRWPGRKHISNTDALIYGDEEVAVTPNVTQKEESKNTQLEDVDILLTPMNPILPPIPAKISELKDNIEPIKIGP
jgi:hypothetical protein